MDKRYVIMPCKKEDYEEVESLVLDSHSEHMAMDTEMFDEMDEYLSFEDFTDIIEDEECPCVKAVDTETDRAVGVILSVISKVNEKDLKTKKEIHVCELYVDKEHRRRGIATELLRGAYDMGKEYGADHMTLNVYSINKEALQFYDAFGMKERSRKLEMVIDDPKDITDRDVEDKKIKITEQYVREVIVSFLDDWGGDYRTISGRTGYMTDYETRCDRVGEVTALIRIDYPCLLFEILLEKEVPEEKKNDVIQLFARINIDRVGAAFLMDYDEGTIMIRAFQKVTQSHVVKDDIDYLLATANYALEEYADLIYAFVDGEISLDDAIKRMDEDEMHKSGEEA